MLDGVELGILGGIGTVDRPEQLLFDDGKACSKK